LFRPNYHSDAADPACLTTRVLIGMADALRRLAPDVLVILGDQFEALAAAQAAPILGIPIAHIHGGEITEHMLADYEYDGLPVTAAVRRGNVTGTQFHPEKSGPSGLAILQAFLEA
jgi:UDP-N-acetylglucosamine 2-epimerase